MKKKIIMETGDSQSSGNVFLNEKLKEYCRELKEKIEINRSVLFIKGLEINVDFFEKEIAKNRCYYAYPPTGLQYLAASLENRNLEIKILDLNFEFLKKIKSSDSFNPLEWISLIQDYMQKNNSSIIGVSNIFSLNFPNFIETLDYLRENHPGRIILAGGQNATYDGERLLNEDLCNFVLQRESENKINFLFDNLYENLDNKATPGILFKYKGKIEESEGEKDVVELKGNLVKAHGLVPIEEYCHVGSLNPYSRMIGKDTRFSTILFNRGCEAGCRHCGVPDYMGRGVRSRSVEDLLDEMEYLAEERGVKHFEFLDDDFARYNDKSLEVLQGIIDRKLNITWASNNGLIAKTVSEELMEKMQESGCLGFKVGIESGNPEILKKLRKPGTMDTFREFSKRAQKFPGMFIVDNYIFGVPNEKFGEMLDSYRFSIEMDLDWSQYSIYQHSVNYFGDKEERKRKRENIIGSFVPTKDFKQSRIDSSEKIYTGLKVFDLDKNRVPSREQLEQIWITFDFARNFIKNKNLKTDGNPEKFIKWTGAVEGRYPTHPYINFYLSLANRIAGNGNESEAQYKKMTRNLEDDFWKKRFESFGLMEIVDNFPRKLKDAEYTLEFLRRKYEK